MIVMKFGCSSVESAAAIQRVTSIVAARRDRHPVVVVSAMGKTTNKLLAIAAEAVKGNRRQALELLCELHYSHLREGKALVEESQAAQMQEIIDGPFHELEELVKGLSVMGELTPRSIDAVSSYGERLSSAIIAMAFCSAGLPAEH